MTPVLIGLWGPSLGGLKPRMEDIHRFHSKGSNKLAVSWNTSEATFPVLHLVLHTTAAMYLALGPLLHSHPLLTFSVRELKRKCQKVVWEWGKGVFVETPGTNWVNIQFSWVAGWWWLSTQPHELLDSWVYFKKTGRSVEVLRSKFERKLKSEHLFVYITAGCNPVGAVLKDKNAVVKSEAMHICDLSSN